MPGMIVAPQPVAVEEGWKVLRDGGNAVDAAVTAAFVQAVVSPQMCGIGGYTLLNLYLPRAETRGFSRIHDEPALAGARVTPDMWVDALIRPNPDGWGYFLKGGDCGPRRPPSWPWPACVDTRPSVRPVR